MTPSLGRARQHAQSFDHLAGWYVRYAELTGVETHTWLSSRLPARAGRVVDLGCGTGVHTPLLASRFEEVLAIDLSGPMLRRARAGRPAVNVRYEQRDLLEVTRGEDGRFDAVVSTFVLHHLPDLRTALEHFCSLVRPGGQLLVVDHVDERRHGSRSGLRREAWRACCADVLRRRRPAGEAAELLRLQLNRDWLDHRASDRIHTPAEWDRLAARVVPDGAISSLGHARGLRWRAPVWV